MRIALRVTAVLRAIASAYGWWFYFAVGPDPPKSSFPPFLSRGELFVLHRCSVTA
jgi:hypothetical protein